MNTIFKKIQPAFLMLLFLLPAEAYLSQVHYREEPLDEVVKNSGVIVVVKAAKPFTTEKTIPIHKDQKKYPPYHQITHHYRIVKILSDKGGVLKTGQVINVDQTTASNDFESHRMYYLEGFSESPIVYAYRREGRVSNNLEEGNHILFLIGPTPQNLFRFTNEFSFEDENMEEQIMQIIRKIQGAD